MRTTPNPTGHFGSFGGQYVPEVLIEPLRELAHAYQVARRNVGFREELKTLLRDYVGRPTPLTYAQRLTRHLGGGHIYLKREDLCHTGAHKINNTMGQVLLAVRMGKKRIIAETGAGQHGVATATAAAYFGLPCEVFMGREDMHRQRMNVLRMELLGAQVRPVDSGSCTLKDACNEALRDWVTNVRTTYYVLGSVVGPHPYPMMVRDFQSVIGDEVKRQFRALRGGVPNYLVACVGGGSNAMGLFHPFRRLSVKMIGVEAAGHGLRTQAHAASLLRGKVGVLHGSRSMLLQNRVGQVSPVHSISAGLDYPGVGPEHAWYQSTGRATYAAVTDREALAGFRLLSETEGIVPALESAHAIAYLQRFMPTLSARSHVVMCLSGRGDKDLDVVAGPRSDDGMTCP